MAATFKPTRKPHRKAEIRPENTYPEPGARPVWELVVELGAQVSAAEWAKVPDDASVNHDHYLYGAPRTHTRRRYLLILDCDCYIVAE